jgi:hypothetical protein
MRPRYLPQKLLVVMLCLPFVLCTPRREMHVLIHMMPDQAACFKNEIIPVFEKNHPYSVTVETYGSIDSIADELQRRKGKISVVKIPFDKARPLMQKGALALLDSFLTPQELDNVRNDYLMTSLGSIGGRPCLIPRKFETRIMVYCKSKVSDAVAVWRSFKPAADSAMALYNGFGLPATYILEDDPELWDYFDIYMVGWIWSHTLYNEKKQGRIGFRGKRYSGTAQRIYDRIYQLGGDSAAICSMEGDAVADAFYWEALYTSAGIYNDGMWREGWSGSDIWREFASENVFLSFMTQLDCFFLHGTGSDNLTGFMKYPDDMGVATMPKACSVDVDATGLPLRIGSKSITTGGWWWAIPADAPDPKAAFQFISFITGTTTQIQECSRFGMIPVRKDILGDMSVMFGGGWISGIYDVSFKQLIQNGYTLLPGNRNFSEITDCYLDLVNEILVQRKWAKEGTLPQRQYIIDRISGDYQSRLQKITVK